MGLHLCAKGLWHTQAQTCIDTQSLSLYYLPCQLPISSLPCVPRDSSLPPFMIKWPEGTHNKPCKCPYLLPGGWGTGPQFYHLPDAQDTYLSKEWGPTGPSGRALWRHRIRLSRAALSHAPPCHSRPLPFKIATIQQNAVLQNNLGLLCVSTWTSHSLKPWHLSYAHLHFNWSPLLLKSSLMSCVPPVC